MLLSHQATIIPVSNIERSLTYYMKILDFECSFQYGEPVSYAVLKKDEISIHLTWTEKEVAAEAQMYIFCHDVEKVYKQMADKSAQILEPLSQTDYGMKEFAVSDPDGHCLVFGQGI